MADTVRIQHPDVPGGMVILAADFREGEHVRFDAPAPKAKVAEQTPAKVPAKAEQARVPAKSGRKR